MKPRDNPFRASRMDALAFRDPCGTTAEDLLRRLRTTGGRGAIVGPMGTGKSTLMRTLATVFSQNCRQVVRTQVSGDMPSVSRDDRMRLRSAAAGDAVCIDGADLLPRRVWWLTRYACRRATYLVVTSHARPLLPVLYRTNPTPALLMGLTRELLDGAPSLTEQESHALLAACRGNMREALRALYDRFQTYPSCTEAHRLSDSSDPRALV